MVLVHEPIVEGGQHMTQPTEASLRRWGRLRREIAEIEDKMQECLDDLAQLSKWLQTDIAWAHAGVANYSGMPVSGGGESVVERRVMETETLRERMFRLQSEIHDEYGRLMLRKQELIDQAREIDTAVARLPQEDQYLLVERYVVGCSYDQIAEVMHKGKSTVWERIEAIKRAMAA
jgi:DNA-directed RNA polymerase specialized sigma24 family protein